MLKVNRHPKSILYFSKFVSQEPVAIIVVNDKIKPTIYTRKDNNKIYLHCSSLLSLVSQLIPKCKNKSPM